MAVPFRCTGTVTRTISSITTRMKSICNILRLIGLIVTSLIIACRCWSVPAIFSRNTERMP
jgi:hypothetical protein